MNLDADARGAEVITMSANGSVETARLSTVAPESEPAIVVRGLSKAYGRREVVKHLDLDVYPGEIVAFLGPNGAGKTTTVEILEGFRAPTAGDVRVLGVDPMAGGREWRDRVGVVLQESQPEPGLTVRECVALYAGYYRTPGDVDGTIDLVGLGDRRDVPAARLSGGQRRRLDVALALIGDPDVVFLDEPTTGFDPSARRVAWEVVAGLRSLGKAVFLTTHYLDEAETLADRIVVFAGGRVVAEGTPETLGGRDRMSATVSCTLPPGLTTRDLPTELRLIAEGDAAALRLRTEDPLFHVHVLAQWALERGVHVTDLDVRRPTLEEVYLALTDPARSP
jgi:ABC-2 type transport system ATP-binding protein